MLEIVKSLAFAVIMVPVAMFVVLGLIYVLGEAVNIISLLGRSKQQRH